MGWVVPTPKVRGLIPIIVSLNVFLHNLEKTKYRQLPIKKNSEAHIKM